MVYFVVPKCKVKDKAKNLREIKHFSKASVDSFHHFSTLVGKYLVLILTIMCLFHVIFKLSENFLFLKIVGV